MVSLADPLGEAEPWVDGLLADVLAEAAGLLSAVVSLAAVS